MGLFSKDTTFYDLLEAQADTAHRAAQEFFALSQDFSRAAEHAETIDQIESEGDTLTHNLANKVDSTFVTPLDKEDLHTLSNNLDNITDYIDAATSRIALYQIRTARPDLPNLVQLLVDITAVTRTAVGFLRDIKSKDQIQSTLIRVHELENQADRAFRAALGQLFNAPGADPIEVMKWKEVYDRVERSVDQCEDVANIVESVVVKYA